MGIVANPLALEIQGSVYPWKVRTVPSGMVQEQSTETSNQARQGKNSLNTSNRRMCTGHERGRKDSVGEGECNRAGKLEARLGAAQSGVAGKEPKPDSTGFAWQEQPLDIEIPEGERIAEGMRLLAVSLLA